MALPRPHVCKSSVEASQFLLFSFSLGIYLRAHIANNKEAFLKGCRRHIVLAGVTISQNASFNLQNISVKIRVLILILDAVENVALIHTHSRYYSPGIRNEPLPRSRDRGFRLQIIICLYLQSHFPQGQLNRPYRFLCVCVRLFFARCLTEEEEKDTDS